MQKIIIITVIFIINIICFSCQKEPQIESEKIWLHQANNIQKAQCFQDKYAGLEIDITYLDSLQIFIVFHGGESFEPNPVTLEQWLEEVGNVDKLGLWFDFKNLNSNNQMSALNELNRLCSKYNIDKSKLIIESSAAQNLIIFQEANYITSYYIPKFDPQKTSKRNIQEYTLKIRKAIESYNITTISGYHYQYQFMRDSFPDKDVLIWYIHNNQIIKNKYIQITNNDHKVKVLLLAEDKY